MCCTKASETENWGFAIKHPRVGQVGSPPPLAAFQSSHSSTDGGLGHKTAHPLGRPALIRPAEQILNRVISTFLRWHWAEL